MARIDDFEGSQADYNHYLERLVYELRAKLHSSLDNSNLNHSTSQPRPKPLDFVFKHLPPISSAQHPPWKSVLSSFLRVVPRTEEEWASRRISVGLSKRSDLVATFCLLTRLSSQPMPFRPREKLDGKADIVTVLGDYTLFASTMAARKVYSVQTSNFANLLFICLSVIALTAGAPEEDVNRHVTAFLTEQQGKCGGGSEYMQRLRTSVTWPIERMKELDKKGLKHRASELFLLCGPSIHSYRKFAAQKGTEAFSDEVTICKPPQEVQADVPFDIAFLAKIILGANCSLDQINKALGTNLEQCQYDTWIFKIDNLIQGMECLSRSHKRLRAPEEGEEREKPSLKTSTRSRSEKQRIQRKAQDEAKNDQEKRIGRPLDGNTKRQRSGTHSPSGRMGCLEVEYQLQKFNGVGQYRGLVESTNEEGDGQGLCSIVDSRRQDTGLSLFPPPGVEHDAIRSSDQMDGDLPSGCVTDLIMADEETRSSIQLFNLFLK